MLTIVVVGVLIALLFDFLNGMNDAANSIATIVATRVLPPFAAVTWAAFWNFAAIFIFGVSVANTMGKGIVDQSLVNEYLILAALIGAVVWVWICTHYGLPISVSHALIGGLIGPIWFTHGTSGLIGYGIFKIAIFIVLAPLIGMILGFLIMCVVFFLFKKTTPHKVDGLFKVLQLFSSAIFSLGHGGNDAQKTMGVIALLLFSVAGSNDFIAHNLFDPLKGFHIPYWLIITCYSVIALGTITGGWRVIKTLGDGLAKLKPVQGFCAETSGALTLIIANVFGIPISTTHTITGSIVGVSLTKGLASVRWATASNIVAAWVLTIPATLVLSGLIYLLMDMCR
ncbi:MAG: inorganic phosphate transporter [Prevotellaceae bacterium]|jgi:PiT family inorganic phosphate transporter|nr:inorganic phosphate transporter [Prevotellaceae bacterium]